MGFDRNKKLSQKLIALSFTDNYRFLNRNFKANFDQDKIIVPAFVIWYLSYIDFRPFGPTLPLWICPRMRFLVTQWMRLFFLFVFFFFFFFFFCFFFFFFFFFFLMTSNSIWSFEPNLSFELIFPSKTTILPY